MITILKNFVLKLEKKLKMKIDFIFEIHMKNWTICDNPQAVKELIRLSFVFASFSVSLYSKRSVLNKQLLK